MQLPRLILASGALLGALFFTGCVSSVNRAPGSTTSNYRLSRDKKAAEVQISISPEAQNKIKDNLKFDQEELRKHLERALAAYSLLDAGQKGTLPTVEILVTSVRVRSNFSAVAFGFVAGGDNISGDILIKDTAGTVLDRFQVSATYALGGLAGGQDSARMGWLYEEFAKQAVQEMTGLKNGQTTATH